MTFRAANPNAPSLIAYISTAHNASSKIFAWGAVVDVAGKANKFYYEGGECTAKSTFEAAIVGTSDLLARIRSRHSAFRSLTVYAPPNLVAGITKLAMNGDPGGQSKFKAQWMHLHELASDLTVSFKTISKASNSGSKVGRMVRLASDHARQHAGLQARPHEKEIELPCPECGLLISAVLKPNGDVVVDYSQCEHI